jgi:hypothetical protein
MIKNIERFPLLEQSMRKLDFASLNKHVGIVNLPLRASLLRQPIPKLALRFYQLNNL